MRMRIESRENFGRGKRASPFDLNNPRRRPDGALGGEARVLPDGQRDRVDGEDGEGGRIADGVLGEMHVGAERVRSLRVGEGQVGRMKVRHRS